MNDSVSDPFFMKKSGTTSGLPTSFSGTELLGKAPKQELND